MASFDQFRCLLQTPFAMSALFAVELNRPDGLKGGQGIMK